MRVRVPSRVSLFFDHLVFFAARGRRHVCTLDELRGSGRIHPPNSAIGVVASIVASQAIDPGSIPGWRKAFFCKL